MTPEGRVKAQVNRALSKLTGVYRFMPVQNGMGAPGLDYHCCIQGLAVYIETKAPGKHMTDRQKATRDNIEAAGGLVFEIHDQAEIDQMIAQIALHLRFSPRRETNDQEHGHTQEAPAPEPARPDRPPRRDEVADGQG